MLQKLAECSVDLWRWLCHGHSDTVEIPALHDSPASAYLKLAFTLQLHHMVCMLQFLTPKDRQNDEYGQLHASGIHCTGRIVLNIWRILRSELKLNIYTFESCVAAVLQLRTPHVQPQVLTHWFNGGPAGNNV